MAPRVVMGLFHPTRDHQYAEPETAVECFGSFHTARRIFKRRAEGHRTGTFYVDRSDTQTDWSHVDSSAHLDLWLVDRCPTEPYVPETFDKRLVIGPRGGVREEPM